MPQISSFRELFSGQLNKNTFPFEYVKVNQNVNGERIIFTSILSPISEGNISIEKIKCLVFFWCPMIVVIAPVSALLSCTRDPKPSTAPRGSAAKPQASDISWGSSSSSATSPPPLLSRSDPGDCSHLLFLWRAL